MVSFERGCAKPATRYEVAWRDDANTVMFTKDEQIAIAGHDGRCAPCDRGREDGVVVRIPRDRCEVWRVYHLGQQLDLRTYRSRERGVVGETSYEDLLKLVHENGAGEERELTAKDTCQKLSR